MRKVIGRITKAQQSITSAENISADDGLLISSYRDLVEQIAELSYLNKDYLLFFRGQEVDYKNKAGSSTFYPNIYRGDYLKQQELNYRFDKLDAASSIISNKFKDEKINGYTEFQRKKYIQWSILQHYEVTDTPLIDVTQSIRVACSFAQMKRDNDIVYIYVFALPYYTNRISHNSEHDIINVRLLSITPPIALRPYFQEGFLVGTEDITRQYIEKSELDLNTRLIAKYKIPNDDTFWGSNFSRIPKTALYPENDKIELLCARIKDNLEIEVNNDDIGGFLKQWASFEDLLLNNSKKYNKTINNVRNSILTLLQYEEDKYSSLKEADVLRRFRNQLVHKPGDVDKDELNKNIDNLNKVYESLKGDEDL